MPAPAQIAAKLGEGCGRTLLFLPFPGLPWSTPLEARSRDVNVPTAHCEQDVQLPLNLASVSQPYLGSLVSLLPTEPSALQIPFLKTA